ncbi:MAG: UDP-N-acetylglucosamine--N-acetylmuramyl-(pentapeptide) pyrophosphoryl-undecaprenol [Acidobacteriaceae bacterium]|jgi:UDP-N-acetylglucosamine--N-acetylmuramyl-(pentapeptide) pyrophosphoryl-undecaprenol N-acetylglucosamine transferase|nr:UDP-N-acetylglucosamine--N-acetylmuramyl-(pentapeptide) pyrophosphoryl-undecaprenol [Acidobacteriaceae bacterium]
MGVKLLIAGGGTGGHVFPAMAIAREWLSRGSEREVVLVGTTRGIEMKLVPQAGLPLETLRVAGLKGKGGGTLLKNLFKLAPAMLDALRVVNKHKPIVAFGVGGYAAGPMLLTTWMRGIPNVIFEPNAEPGFTNKSLARISTRIATGYEISARTWGAKAVVTGCPVRPEFLAIAQRSPQKPLRVLITGGSQGALPVNRAFVDAMNFLATRKNEMSIVHQTGERDYDAVRTAYARHEILAEVVPFLGDMPERFEWADIIVCRAGAITAAEVAAAGRAAIFIPFGRATDSHQLRNAQEMAKQGAGRVITEAELTGERLSQEIFALLDDPQQIERMSTAARKLSWPNATSDIVNLIEQAADITCLSEKVRAAAGSSSAATRAVSTPDREKVAP